MRTSKHEIEKAKWIQNIKEFNESGLTVRDWCRTKGITHGSYYYWLKVIREEALIKAGTLAVTGQPQFAELRPTIETGISTIANRQTTCAVLRSNGNEIEVLNGADPNTLGLILSFLGK